MSAGSRSAVHWMRAVDRARERAGERRLAHAGVVLDEDVPLGEQRDGDVLEHLILDLDGAADVLRDAPGDRDGRVDLGLREPLRDGLLQGFHSASNLYVV
jgi:hypothetical protein